MPLQEIVATSAGEVRLRDVIAENFLPLTLRNAGPQFRMSVRAAVAGAVRIADVNTNAIRVDRERGSALRSEADCYKLLFQIDGQSRIEQRGAVSTVDAGQWVVYDATQPYVIECAHASRFIAVLVPPRSSTTWRWFVERAGVQVRPTAGNAKLALDSIHYLMDGQVPADPESLFGFEQSTLMLLDSVVRREANQFVQSADARSAALRMRAESYLAHHFMEADLTPDGLASALAVSRRTLYNALSASALTPHGLIQQYRLEASRRALEDPNDINRNLVELAISCGFSDISHFGRAFKARFGTTPSAYRLTHREQVKSAEANW
jgi:AraC family transcriptional regulator, positive regulator of tynA and feaB